MKFAIDVFGCTIETLMLVFFYSKLLNIGDYNKKIIISVYGLIGIAMLLVSTFIQSAPAKTAFGLLWVLIPLFLYQGTVINKTILAILFMAVQSLSEMLTKSLSLIAYGNYFELQANFLQNYIHGVLISKLIALFILLIIIALPKLKKYKMPAFLYFILAFIPLVSMFAIYRLRELNYLIDTQRNYFTLTLVTVALITASISIYYLFIGVSEVGFLRTENEVGKTMLSEQQTYIGQLKNENDRIYSITHDTKNKFLAIAGLSTEKAVHDRIKQYVNELSLNICEITGYAELDAIICTKREKAKENKTEIEIFIDIPKGLSINMVDVAIIIANCLDNATEATAKITDTTKRWIKLNLYQKGEFISLQVINPTNEKVIIKNGKIATTKKDKGKHGYGLRNIKDLVNQHNGLMTINSDDKTFTIDITIK